MSPDSRSSLGANLLFVVGSLLFSCLLLAMLEVGMRAADLGEPDASKTSRLKYQQIYLPILGEATQPDGTPVLHTNDKRLPYQAILSQKPKNGLRVITFGGSATAGLGFSPNVTFARSLQRMLEQAYPDRTIEVMNLGIVALASKQVKLMVADACQRYDPDLVVVYSGNNEFLEIHAEKFAEANATVFSGLRDRLVDTNLYRFLTYQIRGAPKAPSLAEQDFSAEEDLRLTQDAIIKDVEMAPEEIDDIIDRYEANVVEMVDAAAEANVPILLMTVASNWKWRGRSDLPENWLDELLESEAGETVDRLEQAREKLLENLSAAPATERHKWLYRRAVVWETLGDYKSARADYRASMNEDPHLRRALDAMAERVRRVASSRSVPLVDTIEVLSSSAEWGIVGFDEFYDYVHFTPRSTVLLAAEIFQTINALGIATPTKGFDLDSYVRRSLAELARLDQDALEVGEWMGTSFDPEMIGDRDLWKYDRMVKGLDDRLEADPDDVRALVYRGNARYFRIDGADEAEQDYRRALEIAGNEPAIRANLERLLAEARP